MKALMRLAYMGWWFVRARFMGRRRPLQSVVFVTSGCDATCRHCTLCTRQERCFKPFDAIAADLDYCYAQGARLLDIEGVYLTEWHDGSHTAADIFSLAREKGFYSVSTMVKAHDYGAWQQMNADADVVWVSVRGIDDCRCLETMTGASLYLVVNADNRGEIAPVMEFVREHEGIRQIAFNMHTPFAGTEEKALSESQRGEVIQSLIDYKRRGYRIMNSVAGLKNMLTLRFKRRCWICNFIYCDGRRSPQCIDDMASGMCEKCGFSMAGEMSAVFAMKPDTILAGLGIRM